MTVKKQVFATSTSRRAREYKAIIHDVVFSSTLKGAKYVGIAEQLKLHASEKLAHALEVARQIDYLGGDPTVKVKDAEYSQDSKRMLEIDLKQVQVTIKHYRENPSSGTLWRICTFGSIKGYYHTGTRSRNRSDTPSDNDNN